MEHFFAYTSRMRFISRWALMRNSQPENIQEHSHQVAVLAHALAVIRNRCFGGQVDPGTVAVAALYHDASEILTGDLPTPIKYYNPAIRDAYKRRRAGSSPLRLIRYEPCSPCVLCMAAGFSQLRPPTTPQRSSAVARHHPCCGTDHDILPKHTIHTDLPRKKKSRRKATLPACQGHTIIICQRPRT